MGNVVEVNQSFRKIGAGKTFAFDTTCISAGKPSMAGPFFVDKKVIR